MLTDVNDNERFIKMELRSRGFDLTSTAMKPMRSIPFSRLHVIHDHDERFLRDRFIECIVDAHAARQSNSGGSTKVNAQDVRTAMLMLGTAVGEAAESTFSQQSLVREICPYC